MENQKPQLPIPNATEYWTSLQNEVKKKIPNITAVEITRGATASKKMKIGERNRREVAEDLLEVIERVFEVYFARDKDKVSDNLKTAIIQFILEHFFMLTVEDIEFSFKRAQIDYDYKQAITLKYFVTFIWSWHNCRNTIWESKKELIRQHEKRTASAIQFNAFQQQCIAKYNEALKTKVWNGDLHESSLLAKKIIDHLPEEEQEDFRELARKQQIAFIEKYEKQQKRGEIKPIGELISFEDTLFATKERLFAKLVVEWGVFNEISLDPGTKI